MDSGKSYGYLRIYYNFIIGYDELTEEPIFGSRFYLYYNTTEKEIKPANKEQAKEWIDALHKNERPANDCYERAVEVDEKWDWDGGNLITTYEFKFL